MLKGAKPRIKGHNGTVGCRNVGPSREEKVVNGLTITDKKKFGEATSSPFISDSFISLT